MIRLSTVIVFVFVFIVGVVVAQPDNLDKAKRDALAKKLKSKKADDRVAAAEEIGKLGEAAKPLARDLYFAMLDKSPALSKKASDALKMVHPKLYPHIVLLMTGVDTAGDHQLKRFDARSSIGELGTDGEAAVPLLMRLVNENTSVVQAALRPGKAFYRQTEELAVTTDITTLGKIAPKEKAVVNMIQFLAVKGPTSPIQQAARKTLEKLNEK